MLSVILYGQNSLPTLHYYYIEGSVTDALKPSSVNILPSGELQLTFKSQNLENFFDNENVYVFEKAFLGAINSQNSTMTIPTSNLAQGTYIVNLIANGSIIDAKQLIVN